MSNVQESSCKAYRELPADTVDGTVYAVFANHRTFQVAGDPTTYRVATRRECAEVLNMQASTVSGAVNRLVKAGWLSVASGPIIDMYTGKMSQHVIARKVHE